MPQDGRILAVALPSTLRFHMPQDGRILAVFGQDGTDGTGRTGTRSEENHTHVQDFDVKVAISKTKRNSPLSVTDRGGFSLCF